MSSMFTGEKGRLFRTLGLSTAYAIGLSVSLMMAYLVRFDFRVPPEQLHHFPLVLAWVVGLKLVLLFLFRQQRVLPSSFSVPDIFRLAYALGTAAAVIGLGTWKLKEPFALPAGMILVDFLFSLAALVLIRMTLRLRRQRLRAYYSKSPTATRRVGIIGAGEAGAMLAAELRNKRGLGLEPVAFFDDDKSKWGRTVCGLPIVGKPELLLNDESLGLRLDEIIISVPSASATRKREILDVMRQAKYPCRTVPSLSELALGKVHVSQLRSVEIQDLLGRPPIKLETENIQALLAGQVVMVTGAGGSIGSELCRQIAEFGPRLLLLVERSEVQMFAIEQELARAGHGKKIVPLVADLMDLNRMGMILEQYKPKVIFHAAAHKHVPLMESQPTEAVRNNSLGTAQFAELAVAHKVERFVLISTDKAINPTSVMGASKRLAEMFLQSLHAANPGGTRMMAVRFGNVLGSSGSVIPIFKEQIARGGPVTVTDPEMTRYFMTIPEAVGLVLQSAAQGQGGEVFLLDMGKPVKIVDLARQIIILSGLEPDKDIKIEFVGLRPGEKLFEELSHEQESLIPTTHPKIMRFCAQPAPLEEMRRILNEFAGLLYEIDGDHCKMLLKRAVPEYTPHFEKGARVTVLNGSANGAVSPETISIAAGRG
ncbi:MAG: polysaccharide biosynthesis protein [Verrucomicrobiales bacterium]|nr:polysaccharide biosynthesis protein [Verrucomicrobiales bacterium]